jgi:hypothetical protein
LFDGLCSVGVLEEWILLEPAIDPMLVNGNLSNPGKVCDDLEI